MCWENRLSDPIDYGSESCESEEGGGELLRAGGDAVVAFDASEEVFDLVTPAVNGLIPGKGVFSVAAWRDAGEPTQLVASSSTSNRPHEASAPSPATRLAFSSSVEN